MSDKFSNYLEVFVVDETTAEGRVDKRQVHTKIGIAIPRKHGEGFNVHITAGVRVSGSFVILPPQERTR